jgi:glucan 1,3-beta-glucosidase
MQALMDYADQNDLIVYFDKGAYVVSTTINIHPNQKITGELYPIIMATGPFFSNELSPQPMWKVGAVSGTVGTVEISDLVFEVKGPCPGAIIIEWNIKASTPAAAGMWDAHWRIGGSAGTNLQQDKCLKNPSHTLAPGDPILSTCQGAFLLLHVTPQADGYFENIWGWVADHELDMGTKDQITIFNKAYVYLKRHLFITFTDSISEAS